MEITYPIFVKAKDDPMVEMIRAQRDLGRYDNNDVESGLFGGWDVNGIPIELYMNEGRTCVRIVSCESKEEELRNAIVQYAELARPECPLSNSATQSDVIQLYRGVESHIRQRRFRRWIRRTFRR